jgi:hypothetical protein
MSPHNCTYTPFALAPTKKEIEIKRKEKDELSLPFTYPFYFSALTNGVWVNTGVGKIGNIVYAPAYPGALFGNMSVAYGNVLPATTDPTTALDDFSGYTGGYLFFLF